MALTTKQRVFIEHYLRLWNGYKAAIEAGYSETSARHQASRMLSNDNILLAIQARLAELKMSADEVLVRLTDQARGSMADFLDVAGDIDLRLARERGMLHLVKSRSVTKEGERIELYDAQAALALLGRHHKLFVDRTEHTGADGAPLAIQFNQALDAAYADDPDTTDPE